MSLQKMWMVTGLVVLWGWGGMIPEAMARQGRERFMSVEPHELVENPQRYWSRGIVFEDRLQHLDGRTRRLGDRRVQAVDTHLAERVYLADPVYATLGPEDVDTLYLWVGTVLSQSRRNLLGRQRTQYYVVIDQIEPIIEDTADDVRARLSDDAPAGSAWDMLNRATQWLQREVVAEAENRGVAVESFFDLEAPRLDHASELARRSVRQLERELGITSIEILSIMIRALVAEQYALPMPLDPESDTTLDDESTPDDELATHDEDG